VAPLRPDRLIPTAGKFQIREFKFVANKLDQSLKFLKAKRFIVRTLKKLPLKIKRDIMAPQKKMISFIINISLYNLSPKVMDFLMFIKSKSVSSFLFSKNWQKIALKLIK